MSGTEATVVSDIAERTCRSQRLGRSTGVTQPDVRTTCGTMDDMSVTDYPEGLVNWREAKVPHWVNAGIPRVGTYRMLDDDEKPDLKASPQVCCYASLIDSKTLDQCKAIARMPFVKPYVAIMPDAHLGKGCAIGSVVPTERAVIPAAVGVDLGCGMIALRTNVMGDEVRGRARTHDPLEKLRDMVEDAIPLSAGNYNVSTTRFPFTLKRVNDLADRRDDGRVDFKGLRNSENWANQLGTLGGGNHFIELSVDENDVVWLFLHSGSRGVGNALANRRIKEAQELCKKWQIPLEQADLAYFPEGTPEFTQYLRDVNWAQHFALLNREEMMDRFALVFSEWIGSGGVSSFEEERINCHHNYVVREGNLWITRKGAIDAHVGVQGVIPGSMGDKSYVVTGLGNTTGLNSAPHGAGRLYSRSKAKATFTENDLREQMEGIVYRHGPEWVDEIPSCYKPVAVVMQDASTLVKPVATLTQLLNVKGT